MTQKKYKLSNQSIHYLHFHDEFCSCGQEKPIATIAVPTATYNANQGAPTPTAELENKFRPHVKTWDCCNDVPLKENHAKECVKIAEKYAIEFAKLHVAEALKACAENAKIFKNSDMVDIEYIDYFEVDKNSILNAYPLDNIK